VLVLHLCCGCQGWVWSVRKATKAQALAHPPDRVHPGVAGVAQVQGSTQWLHRWWQSVWGWWAGSREFTQANALTHPPDKSAPSCGTGYSTALEACVVAAMAGCWLSGWCCDRLYARPPLTPLWQPWHRFDTSGASMQHSWDCCRGLFGVSAAAGGGTGLTAVLWCSRWGTWRGSGQQQG
jgi:hypothetical protein